jgi:hypothetical protein
VAVEHLIDLDALAQRLRSLTPEWERWASVGPFTWRDEHASWPQPIVSDRAAVNVPETLGVRLQRDDDEKEIVVWTGGLAEIDWVLNGEGASLCPEFRDVDGAYAAVARNVPDFGSPSNATHLAANRSPRPTRDGDALGALTIEDVLLVAREVTSALQIMGVSLEVPTASLDELTVILKRKPLAKVLELRQAIQHLSALSWRSAVRAPEHACRELMGRAAEPVHSLAVRLTIGGVGCHALDNARCLVLRTHYAADSVTAGPRPSGTAAARATMPMSGR